MMMTARAILAIDQAASSGWSLWLDGKLSKWGEAKGTSECADVVDLTTEMTRRPGQDPDILVCLVVFEDHSSMRMGGRRKGGKRVFETSSAVLLGMGRSHGWWEVLLNQAGHDDRARVKVAPQTWKSKVLGCNANRDTSIAMAQRHALALGAKDTGPDSAVAIAMGHWATLAPEAEAAWLRAYGPKSRSRKKSTESVRRKRGQYDST